jgi:hypothetical protein
MEHVSTIAIRWSYIMSKCRSPHPPTCISLSDQISLMSSKNTNPRVKKRPKLNVYTAPDPSAPTIHKTYSFVSRSEGYQARSSRIVSAEHSSSSHPLEPEFQPEISYNEAGTTADNDVGDVCANAELGEEVEANNRSIRKHTAGVSLPLHVSTKVYSFFRITPS